MQVMASRSSLALGCLLMSAHPPQGFAGLDSVLDSAKVQDVVSAVWDHKDDVGAAVTFVRDHGDELMALAGRLPELFAAASTALSQAAGDTRTAAQFLTGRGGDASGGVKALSALAGDALDTCRHELTSAKDMLDGLASDLAGLPLIGGAAGQKLSDGAARFDAVGVQLAAVAEQLRTIGGLVDQAGAGLASTADRLDAGGAALATFAH